MTQIQRIVNRWNVASRKDEDVNLNAILDFSTIQRTIRIRFKANSKIGKKRGRSEAGMDADENEAKRVKRDDKVDKGVNVK